MVQRREKARSCPILAQEGQQRVDEATASAAVGRLRLGGTAAGDSSPFAEPDNSRRPKESNGTQSLIGFPFLFV